MRGVHDHRRRRWHLAHHAAAQRVPLELADSLLHLGVAVGFLGFVANFHLAHAHVLLEILLLPEQIEAAPNHEQVGRLP